MEDAERKTDRTELCPICREGVLTIRDGKSEPCNFCDATYDEAVARWAEAESETRPSNKTQIYRIRVGKQSAGSDSGRDRNLAFALSELGRLSAANGLPKTVEETSAGLYRKASEKNLFRGRSSESVTAATVYAACRLCNVPRTLDEISGSGGVGKRELGRTYRHLVKGLNLNTVPVKPQEFVKRLCVALKTNEKIRDTAIGLLDDLDKTGTVPGISSAGMSAGAVYLASMMCEEHFSQREIASAAEISRLTLRKGYLRIAEVLNLKVVFS